MLERLRRSWGRLLVRVLVVGGALLLALAAGALRLADGEAGFVALGVVAGAIGLGLLAVAARDARRLRR